MRGNLLAPKIGATERSSPAAGAGAPRRPRQPRWLCPCSFCPARSCGCRLRRVARRAPLTHRERHAAAGAANQPGRRRWWSMSHPENGACRDAGERREALHQPEPSAAHGVGRDLGHDAAEAGARDRATSDENPTAPRSGAARRRRARADPIDRRRLGYLAQAPPRGPRPSVRAAQRPCFDVSPPMGAAPR